MKKTGRNKKDLESSFQREVIQLIESMGGYVIKIHVSAYQSQGEPDLVCCYKGRFIAFELKVDGNKPSALQLEKLHDIQKAGGIALPIYNINEIKEILYEISRVQQGGEPER